MGSPLALFRVWHSDLSDWILRSHLGLSERVAFIAYLVKALKFAHSHGLVAHFGPSIGNNAHCGDRHSKRRSTNSAQYRELCRQHSPVSLSPSRTHKPRHPKVSGHPKHFASSCCQDPGLVGPTAVYERNQSKSSSPKSPPNPGRMISAFPDIVPVT